jgi:uncharacterized protein
MTKIFNTTKQVLIAGQAEVANSAPDRMIGLLKKDHLDKEEALVITHCSSIHMFFMKFAIDVVFIDKHNKVVGLVEKIKPFQLSPIFWRANQAIELPAGTISEKRIEVGDRFQILP